jgi:hypothetical protein
VNVGDDHIAATKQKNGNAYQQENRHMNLLYASFTIYITGGQKGRSGRNLLMGVEPIEPEQRFSFFLALFEKAARLHCLRAGRSEARLGRAPALAARVKIR